MTKERMRESARKKIKVYNIYLNLIPLVQKDGRRHYSNLDGTINSVI